MGGWGLSGDSQGGHRGQEGRGQGDKEDGDSLHLCGWLSLQEGGGQKSWT